MSLCPNSSIESVHVLKHNSFPWNFISTMTLFLRKMEDETLFLWFQFILCCFWQNIFPSEMCSYFLPLPHECRKCSRVLIYFGKNYGKNFHLK